MIIPVKTDYRMTRTPWVNYAIIAINVLLYVLGYNGSSMAHSQKIAAYLLHPDAPQLYQFVTCTFLHANFWHLAGNMVFLWVFGNAVNDRFGQLGYLMFYLAGGILAGLGYVVLSGLAPVLGASGAIAAVTGAYLVLLPRARVTVLAFLVVIFPFELSSLYFLAFQVVWNIFMSFSTDVGGHSAGGVAYAAHSSGYVFGIFVSIFLLAIRALPRDPFDALNLFRTFQRRSRYRQMVAQGYDPFSFIRPQMQRQEPPLLPWQSAPPPTEMDAREAQLRRDIYEALSHSDLATAAEKYLQLVQIADDAVLPRQQQLDIANYLNTADRFPAAADAYERFLKHYGQQYENIGDIQLVLGLLYSRYLHQYDRAMHYLDLAAQNLKDPRRLELAQSDLRALRQQKGL